MAKLFTLLLILINVALAVSGQLSIKAGMKQVGYITSQNAFQLVLSSFRNVYVVAGLLAYALAAVTWIMVLSRVDVSFAYPMLSIGYIAVLIFSVVYLGEVATLTRIVGTGLIIAGVVLIFRS